MKKQTVIVTGASSGIGKEIARHFLDNDDNVVINSLTAGKLAEVYRGLGSGPNLAMVAGDVSHKDTGAQLLSVALEQFGSADILVNNAGIYETRPFLDVDEAYLDRFLNTNLKGTFFTTQAILPQMIRQQHGVVINIGTPWCTMRLAVHLPLLLFLPKVLYMHLRYSLQQNSASIISGSTRLHRALSAPRCMGQTRTGVPAYIC